MSTAANFDFASDSLDTWHSESNNTWSLPHLCTHFVTIKECFSAILIPQQNAESCTSFSVELFFEFSVFFLWSCRCRFGSYRVSAWSWSASLPTGAIIVDSAVLLGPSCSQYSKLTPCKNISYCKPSLFFRVLIFSNNVPATISFILRDMASRLWRWII